MSKNTKIICLVAIGAAFIVFIFLRDRVSAYLPYLLILLCPLLHLVFMGRMNHGQENKPEESPTAVGKSNNSKPSCH